MIRLPSLYLHSKYGLGMQRVDCRYLNHIRLRFLVSRYLYVEFVYTYIIRVDMS